MIITRVSPLTGRSSTMDLPITQAQITMWHSRRTSRKPGGGSMMVLDIFPHLTAEQREFVMTGYTPEDWKVMFPPKPDEKEEV